MVKITSELISKATQFTNTLKDREIDLRGQLTAIGHDGDVMRTVTAVFTQASSEPSKHTPTAYPTNHMAYRAQNPRD